MSIDFAVVGANKDVEYDVDAIVPFAKGRYTDNIVPSII
jgi:hypothetical protein